MNKKTLERMDKDVDNLKKGKVGKPILFDKLKESIEEVGAGKVKVKTLDDKLKEEHIGRVFDIDEFENEMNNWNLWDWIVYGAYRVKDFFVNIYYWFYYLPQRISRGWTDEETFCLDYHIAKFILPRLKRFKEIKNSHPGDTTEKEWDEILDKIIWSFDAIINKDWGGDYVDHKLLKTDFKKYLKENKKINARVQKGLDLFAKHFSGLWD